MAQRAVDAMETLEREASTGPLHCQNTSSHQAIKDCCLAKMMKGKDALLDSSNLEGTSEFLSRGINKKLRDFRVEYSKL